MSKYVLLKYNKKNVYRCGMSFRLIPGMNEVRREVWDGNEAKKDCWPAVKDNPQIKKLIVAGDLEVQGAPKPVAEPAPEDEKNLDANPEAVLADWSSTEAIKIVEETLLIETLESWLEQETRKGVLKAINKQIESLMPDEKEPEEE